jgi:ABC-type lipoprotein release transport system permease subunit
MMKSHLLRLAARNTLRHRARTLLTAGMVGVGVALLIVALSWLTGIYSKMLDDATAMAGHVRIVTREYAAREELHPLYENLHDVAPLVEVLERQPGVTSVQPRIGTGVTVTVGEEIGEVFALAVGAPEAYFTDHVKAPEQLDRGRWFQGPGELVMGHRVARQAGAVLGDEVVLLGLTQDGSLSPVKGTLTGILRGGASFFDQQVFLPLEEVQWLTDIPDGALEVLVFGERYQDAGALARRLRGLPELEGLAVQGWNERDPWAGLMQVANTMQGIIVFFIVLLAALGILNTMMMSVLERTSEIGVLRAMGLRRTGVVGLFVFEALAIAVVGGLAGLVLGFGPAWLLQSRGVRLGEDLATSLSPDLPLAATVYGQVTGGILLGGFLLGLLTAVVGTVIPAIRAASVQPDVAMRTKR